MITLGSSITYTPPALNGKTFPSVTTSTLSVAFTDNPDFYNGPGQPLGRVTAKIFAVPAPLVLWAGAAYQAIGNWTQDQANAQVLELLGSNPAQAIESLF